MKYAILDIDGCCLDNTARIQHLLKGDHEEFHRLWFTDKPIEQGVAVYSALLKTTNISCVFNTSRSDTMRQHTVKQLRILFPGLLTKARLLMRKDGDTREDIEIKLENLQLSGIAPKDVFICFDDRPSICEAYRNLGMVAYQTAEGY